MINNCIYCNSSENLNTQLNLKLEDGTVAVVNVCDEHAEEATIKSARERYLGKKDQIDQFFAQAKELGIDVGQLQIIGDSSPKAVEPVVEAKPATTPNEEIQQISEESDDKQKTKTVVMKTNDEQDDGSWITTEKFKDVRSFNPKVSGSAPGVANYSSYEVAGNQDRLSEDLTAGKVKMTVAEGRGGQPIPIPQTRIDGTGTTNIRIVNQETDVSLQNRFRQMASQENAPDFRQGYQDSQRNCPICKGNCTIKGKECPKCKGLGVISVY